MKEKRKKNEILAENANMTQKHVTASQALVSSIILLLGFSGSRSGPFPRNERQPALFQGIRG
jgi:hypothetical protein